MSKPASHVCVLFCLCFVQRQENNEKPWITKGILKSIKKKNQIYRKCIRTKNAIKKEELHNIFKSYRNSFNKIARLSKANHYKTFFEDNKNKLNKV